MQSFLAHMPMNTAKYKIEYQNYYVSVYALTQVGNDTCVNC